MAPRCILALVSCLFLSFIAPITAASVSSTSSSHSSTSTHISTSTNTATATSSSLSVSSNSTITSASAVTTSTPPDVYLNVPNLSVGLIELDVDNLQADINLNAAVAGLVTLNAGVAVSIQNVNLTIQNVDAQLELVVRLGNLVAIVNRVFQSLDLNPLLISAANGLSDVLSTVVGAVDGLLGTITQGGTTLSFLVDNLGNIVQEVAGTDGTTTSSIVGNYLTNMTYTGQSETLSGGLVQKTYSYSPLNTLVNIVFNTAGQIVQATVAQATGSSTSASVASSTATQSA